MTLRIFGLVSENACTPSCTPHWVNQEIGPILPADSGNGLHFSRDGEKETRKRRRWRGAWSSVGQSAATILAHGLSCGQRGRGWVSRSHSSDPGARLAHAVPAAGSHTSRGRALSRRRKGAPLGAGDEGFRRHDKRAGVPVSVPLPLLRVLVQTWRGEPTTHLRARICPVNSFAAQNMPSCTGRSCNGRAGVGEGSPPTCQTSNPFERIHIDGALSRCKLVARWCRSSLKMAL